MELKKKEDFLNGEVLLIDKPRGWSSFQAVNAVRWAIRRKFNLKKIKVGHAGTLDPLASGLLLICTGKFTKNIHEYQGQVKEYIGSFKIGATTASYDLETGIDQEYPVSHISELHIRETAIRLTGQIEQMPPVFSAIKKDGKRLYEYAREGLDVEIKPRLVEIEEFEIVEIAMPVVRFRVVCSKGTYIRSLAHDFGRALDSGAHLSALRRTKIGEFHVNNALAPSVFQEIMLAEDPKAGF